MSRENIWLIFLGDENKMAKKAALALYFSYSQIFKAHQDHVQHHHINRQKGI